MTSTAPLTIRPARPADRSALENLARMDSQRPLTGSALLAESHGHVVAAVSADGTRAIADPFLPTAATVAVLRVRAAQLRAAAAPAPLARRRLGLHPASG